MNTLNVRDAEEGLHMQFGKTKVKVSGIKLGLLKKS